MLSTYIWFHSCRVLHYFFKLNIHWGTLYIYIYICCKTCFRELGISQFIEVPASELFWTIAWIFTTWSECDVLCIDYHELNCLRDHLFVITFKLQKLSSRKMKYILQCLSDLIKTRFPAVTSFYTIGWRGCVTVDFVTNKIVKWLLWLWSQA